MTRERTYFTGGCNDMVSTPEYGGFNWVYERVFDMPTEPSEGTINALADLICHGNAFNRACIMELDSGTDTDVVVEFIDYAITPFWEVTLYQSGLAGYVEV